MAHFSLEIALLLSSPAPSTRRRRGVKDHLKSSRFFPPVIGSAPQRLNICPQTPRRKNKSKSKLLAVFIWKSLKRGKHDGRLLIAPPPPSQSHLSCRRRVRALCLKMSYYLLFSPVDHGINFRCIYLNRFAISKADKQSFRVFTLSNNFCSPSQSPSLSLTGW